MAITDHHHHGKTGSASPPHQLPLHDICHAALCREICHSRSTMVINHQLKMSLLKNELIRALRERHLRQIRHAALCHAVRVHPFLLELEHTWKQSAQMKDLKEEIAQFLREKHLRFICRAALFHAVRRYPELNDLYHAKSEAVHVYIMKQEMVQMLKQHLFNRIRRAALCHSVCMHPLFMEIEHAKRHAAQMSIMKQEMLKVIHQKLLGRIRHAALCHAVRMHPLTMDLKQARSQESKIIMLKQEIDKLLRRNHLRSIRRAALCHSIRMYPLLVEIEDAKYLLSKKNQIEHEILGFFPERSHSIRNFPELEEIAFDDKSRINKQLKQELLRFLRQKHLRFIRHAAFCRSICRYPFIKHLEFIFSHPLPYLPELIKVWNEAHTKFEVEAVRRAALNREIRKISIHSAQIKRKRIAQERAAKFAQELKARVPRYNSNLDEGWQDITDHVHILLIAIRRNALLHEIRRHTIRRIILEQKTCASRAQIYKKELQNKVKVRMLDAEKLNAKQEIVCTLKNEMIRKVQNHMDRYVGQMLYAKLPKLQHLLDQQEDKGSYNFKLDGTEAGLDQATNIAILKIRQ